MRLSTEKLKEDLSEVLDEVLETGIPVEIERKGHILRIIAESKGKKLDNLVPTTQSLEIRKASLISTDLTTH